MNGDKTAAQFILRALLQGADPETGKPLHKSEVVHKTEVMRALTLALEALGGGARPAKTQESRKPQKATKGKRPERAGEGWAQDEDAELRLLFSQRRPVPAMAAELGRTRGAITARLLLLKLIKTRHDL